MSGTDDSADSFFYISYLAEAAIKTIAIGLCAFLRDRAPTHAYRLEHALVRADGLGSWETAIREATSEPLSTFIPPAYSSSVAWIQKKRTKPEDEWLRAALADAHCILQSLESDEVITSRIPTVKDLIVALVQIRNKTKAHGAVGTDFFSSNNERYQSSVRALVTQCPIFTWPWLHLSLRKKGNVRGVRLAGNDPIYMRDHETAGFVPRMPGIYIIAPDNKSFVFCGALLRTDLEAKDFFLPNGGYTGKGSAEFIDYGSGRTIKQSVDEYAAPPVLPPLSETEGLAELVVQGNLLANLPSAPRAYIERRALERELHSRLKDRNHELITLHGRGGVGKTSLALQVAHALAHEEKPRFDVMLWFSARDVELKPAGPTFVRPGVTKLNDIAKVTGKMLQVSPTLEGLAELLQDSSAVAKSGILFIFDNFETIADITDLHRFLDTHTHLPNKTLITSRERAFKADYPIEVRGMEEEEAAALMRSAARELDVTALLTPEVEKGIYTSTEGHAYLIRVVMGEMAKEGRFVPPKQLVSRRLDIVDAVFERSFDRLSDEGRVVFLTITGWRSGIPALALLIVLGQDIDVDAGLDECLRLSLIHRDYLADGQPLYHAPELARVFGRKKVQAAPERLDIEGYLQVIRKFGVITPEEAGRVNQNELNQKFIKWLLSEGETGNVATARLDGLLEGLAQMWPPAWLELARFREAMGFEQERIAYAYTRAVEETPDDTQAWVERGTFADATGDQKTAIASLVTAAETAPSEINLLLDVAAYVIRYITAHASEISPRRRGVYLASIRSLLEKVVDGLSPSGRSELGWLYLLEGDKEKAEMHAKAGLTIDVDNEHCLGLLARCR